ncbi:hypothetical protein PYJP_14940 [Pyrofollis japonicus]|nr:hypothetical protein PYJP_14940 [Pyrofollis japonicus]
MDEVTGIVIYVSDNPFRRAPRAEYKYGAVSDEGVDPVAPLLNEALYDNIGFIVVPDTHSVWPEVGAFPKSTSYREVIDKLKEAATRRCSIRLSPRTCRRVHYVVVPWSRIVGGWAFDAYPADALALALSEILETILEKRPKLRIDTVYVVIGGTEEPFLKSLSIRLGELLAALTHSKLVILGTEQPPYPTTKEPIIEVREAEKHEALQVLLAQLELIDAEKAIRNKLLVPRTPLGARRYGGRPEPREIELTVLSALAAKKSYYILLPYQACGSLDPLRKIATILAESASTYIDETRLHKKRVGGTVVHHLGFNIDKLRSLILGAAVEQLVLKTMVSSTCSELYSAGMDTTIINKISSMFGKQDATPKECIKGEENKVSLQEGCVRKLRNTLLKEYH